MFSKTRLAHRSGRVSRFDQKRCPWLPSTVPAGPRHRQSAMQTAWPRSGCPRCSAAAGALDKIVAAAAKRGIAAGMYFIPPEMDPNFFVQKGFKFFTMPWGPWAKAGIQNGLSGIKR